MNKIVEEVAKAILSKRHTISTWDQLDFVPNQELAQSWKRQALIEAKAAIACIAGGELDEKALQAALAPNGFLPERETAEAIKTYLSNLKESV